MAVGTAISTGIEVGGAIIGGITSIFGGGPEDIDCSEVESKLYPGRWNSLDDEMKPIESGGARASQDLRRKMSADPRIRDAARQFADRLIRDLQANDLMQNCRGPNSDEEVANVVAWAAKGGVGSSDWGPKGQGPAKQILAMRVQRQENGSTNTLAGFSLDQNTLLLLLAGVGGFLIFSE